MKPRQFILFILFITFTILVSTSVVVAVPVKNEGQTDIYLPVLFNSGIGSWEMYSEPVLEPGPTGSWDQDYVICPTILFNGTQYRMWYSGGTHEVSELADEIGYATSVNGIDWVKHPDNPILKIGESGDWDDQYIREPVVLYDGSTWKMWYEGVNKSTGTHQIGYATSEDGVSWEKYDGNPVLVSGPSGSWDQQGVGGPHVILEDGVYYMWYYNQGYIGSIGLATSPDGITWTKFSGNPLLTPPFIGVVYNGFKSPTVVDVFGEYQLWLQYSLVDRADYQSITIIHKTSPDGIHWADGDSNLPGEFFQTYFCPAVIFHNDVVKMWYTTLQRIFYAEAPLY